MSSLSTTSPVWEDEMGAMADQLFFVTSYRYVVVVVVVVVVVMTVEGLSVGSNIS
jgi:hypothetical protein